MVVTRTQWVARLAFTDQSTDEGQFVVERASAAGPDTSFREVQRISGSPPGEAGGRVFYSDPTGGGIFAYRVRAANAAGVSEPSNTVTITVSQGFEFGFGGVFFNDRAFSGDPVYASPLAIFYAHESWDGAPYPGVQADGFSALFESYLYPEFDERYTFYTASDDGVALTVIDTATNTVVLDFDNLSAQRDMPDQGFQDVAGSADLLANRTYFVRLRYTDETGPAGFRVGWSSFSTPQEILPGVRLFGVQPRGPRVKGVFASAGGWGPDFDQALASRDAGQPAIGFRVPGGAEQLDPLPWTGVDQISIRFPQLPQLPLSVGRDDLAVTGADGSAYGFSDFAYDPASLVATWTLSRPVAADRLLLDLHSGPGGVAILGPGGLALDGEWVDNESGISGDGKPGGDFLFHLNVLPGDVTRDGAVNALDVADVKRRLNSTTTTSAGAGYSVFADVNGDGRINALDLAAVKQRLNTRLPDAQPAAAASPAVPLLAASATRDLFASDPILA